MNNNVTEQNAARWVFMMTIMDNQDGPEYQAMSDMAQELEPKFDTQPDVVESVKFNELIDAAMAKLAETADA